MSEEGEESWEEWEAQTVMLGKVDILNSQVLLVSVSRVGMDLRTTLNRRSRLDEILKIIWREDSIWELEEKEEN